VQTQTQIRSLLAAAGLRPTKKRGQHFLVDGNLMRKLVASAAIQPDDVVLEVGAGTGSLTKELASAAGAVIAVEIDAGLADIAAAELADLTNVTLLRRDVLAAKSRIDPQVIDALVEARERHGGRVLLVANLPYQVASPLIIDLLTGSPEFARMCFTVQKEVGGRLLARPGGKDYGPLSVIVQALAEVHRIAAVPPQAFWPIPEVDSVMVRVDPSPERRGRIPGVAHFTGVVKTCFLHRRKTLAHNLTDAYGADVAERVMTAMGIEPRTRPERLDVSAWVELAHALVE